MGKVATCHGIVLEQRSKGEIDSQKGMEKAAATRRLSTESITTTTTTCEVFIATTSVRIATTAAETRRLSTE